MAKVFSLKEIAEHNRDGDCWVVIDSKVYDVSKFAKLHPGGRAVLVNNSGGDVTELFSVYHNSSILQKYGPKLLIGTVVEHEQPSPKLQIPGAFGDMVPFGDPSWYQRLNSPYYKETHAKWRKYVRDFVETEIMPGLEKWKMDPEPPKELYMKMGDAGLLASMCTPWPEKYLPAHVNSKKPENFDYFHELITYDEISRVGYSSVIAALTNGPAIALSAILSFGPEEMKQRVAPDVLLGRKFIALAVSEPNAGSDVAGMETIATPDGDHYVVTGNKKWITNGTYSHFFVTAVRTGRRGQLSFILVDRDTPGFTVRKLNIRDSHISGTAYLDFDNCIIPKTHLIGKQNEGFKLIVHNFNHERFYIVAIVCRLSRICLEESVKYALKRRAFGKRLSEVQAIRLKISAMARQIESLQSWLELVTYQLCTMSHKEANMKLGDVISLLKAHASRVYEFCARETTMVFGGNALYADGVGRKIECAVAQVKGYQIPAGAEDVMDDYAGRVAFKMAMDLAKL